MKIADIDILGEAIIDSAYPSSRAVYGVGLQLLACCDCVFECH